MDSAELHYVTYDPEAIWDEMQRAYIDEGGDVLYGGDEKEILLRAAQAIVVQLLAGVDNALRMATLRYAQGEYLKIIGEDRFCPYIEATAATGTVRLIFRATGQPEVLPAGLAMTADGERYYTLAEAVAQTGYAQEIDVGIVCTEAGAIGNGLSAGTELQLMSIKPGVARVVVTGETRGGTNAEDFELYRERIRRQGLLNVTTGPERQYEDAAKAVTSEIMDARALRLAPGVVGIYLLLAEDAHTDAILESVAGALSATDVRPLTDDVQVFLSPVKTYTLKVGYRANAEATAATHAAIAEAVKAYEHWQNRTVGRRPFNPERLAALLYQAGCEHVAFLEGSAFDGGPAQYTELAADTHVSGDISLVVMA